MSRKINDKIKAIAWDILSINDLETTNSGRDFPEVAVWLLREALKEAYQKGFEDGQRHNPKGETS